ncbi:hypothetical protein ACQP00_14240 [Dactylosporangium sp. CS-047395]|uniref:hypothetical protein n=1 Tax=Dactylosporangium sp. CS-047395 TaxID=3239936 RepID=UPI003D8B4E7A
MTSEALHGGARTWTNPATTLIDHARQACIQHRVSFEGTDPLSVRLPGDAVAELLQQLAGRTPRMVEQIVPFAPGARRNEPLAGMIWRQLAAARCRVMRYYLVPTGSDALARAREQAGRDLQESLVPALVQVGQDWVQGPNVPLADLWLIDDQVVVRRELGGGPASWLVSGHAKELDNARRLLGRLKERADKELKPEATAGPDLTGDLLESAQMLYSLAGMACKGSKYIDPKDCRWYHGSWQYLRLFNMVSSPSWHSAFYMRALQRRFAAGDRKVLVSGTADYTTLAFVLAAARNALGQVPKDLEVQVLDLCRTPLMASEWYAKKLGLADHVRFLEGDITDPCALKKQGASGFQVIVADAFLTRFGSEQAHQVVTSWHQLLADGGHVLTTVRLHPRNAYPPPDTEEPAVNDRYRVTDPTDDFELRLRERAAGWRGMLPIDLDDLTNVGRQYAIRMKSNDLGDVGDVEALFLREQFTVEKPERERVDGELVSTQYLRIEAIKAESANTPSST